MTRYPGGKGRPATKGTRKGTGPATGAGWGGPAKGTSPLDAQPFEPGNQAAAGRAQPDWRAVQDRKAQAELVKDTLYELAFRGETGHVRVAAADKFLSRIEGAPVTRGELSGPGGAPLVPAIDYERRSYVDDMLRRLAGSAPGDTLAGTADSP